MRCIEMHFYKQVRDSFSLVFQISRYSHESMERPSVEMDEIVRVR